MRGWRARQQRGDNNAEGTGNMGRSIFCYDVESVPSRESRREIKRDAEFRRGNANRVRVQLISSPCFSCTRRIDPRSASADLKALLCFLRTSFPSALPASLVLLFQGTCRSGFHGRRRDDSMDGRALFNPRFFERSQSALIRDLAASQRRPNGHEVVLPGSSQLIPPFSFHCPSPSGLIPTARPCIELIFSRRCAVAPPHAAIVGESAGGEARRLHAAARNAEQLGAAIAFTART
jgi:hypothetical protein